MYCCQWLVLIERRHYYSDMDDYGPMGNHDQQDQEEEDGCDEDDPGNK